MGQLNVSVAQQPDEQERFLRVIQASLGVRRHFDLFCWLQGELQHFVPHDILVVAWGDLSSGAHYIDVISPLPGMRTGPVINRDLKPFLKAVFGQWRDYRYSPFSLNVPDGFIVGSNSQDTSIARSFRSMRSAAVHGIKDRRGQHDCLYIFFSEAERVQEQAAGYLEVLLPQIDTALRQVSHLPEQLKEPAEVLEFETKAHHSLSDRECQIMEWVCSGKTNYEIGQILSISSFTVKNHLQRIFRKLQVANRAQAVATFGRAGGHVRSQAANG